VHHQGHHRRRHGHDARIARTREIVLAAARRILLEEGPEAVTALRVSEATGIARTTIYRHWPGRDLLLLETLASVELEQPSFDTGDLRDDLIGFLGHLGRRIGGGSAAPFLTAMAQRAQHDRAAAALYRDRVDGWLGPLREILRSGIESGELPESLPIEVAVARLAGPILSRGLVAGLPVDGHLVTGVVDGFLAAPHPHRPKGRSSR
jgi:AcrR family transcriptional regulator